MGFPLKMIQRLVQLGFGTFPAHASAGEYIFLHEFSGIIRAIFPLQDVGSDITESPPVHKYRHHSTIRSPKQQLTWIALNFVMKVYFTPCGTKNGILNSAKRRFCFSR